MADVPDPGGLTVHPLIRGLAVGLQNDQPDLKQAKLAAVEPDPPEAATFKSNAKTARGVAYSSVGTLLNPPRPDVVMFAGYLGPDVPDPQDETDETKSWRLLYHDENAVTWLLVPETAIVLHQRAPDKKAAFQLRDVIWVRADAPVRQGEDAVSQQARFLVGTFTCAGDLHGSLTDPSVLSPASGILCAPTPECCTRHSR